MTDPLLEVIGLKKYFSIKSGFLRHSSARIRAVDHVSFTIPPQKTLGLVGESGCGKSTVARAILRLIEPTAGKILFNGRDITHLRENELRPLRSEMQIIFQDPYASLNPRLTVAETVGEPLSVHRLADNRKQRQERVAQLLTNVGLRPEQMKCYPHEFSGGQRQRIGIARALAVNPKLIIADEAVSALDVSIQAQVINLLKDLQKEFGLTYLFISHDLSVIKHISDRVAVMYFGKVVELAHKKALFARPLHPYTESLLSAIPIPDPKKKRKRIVLEGDVPSSINPPSGCRFHPRCPKVMDICHRIEPQFRPYPDDRWGACHLFKQPVVLDSD